ncbi:MAG: exodeoxyribonuclease V subunit gamma [Lachnospiraceae bacterium]|nr:exodeoxyribonuclease V subunit gamma [Lachnospiraceae bacterium]
MSLQLMIGRSGSGKTTAIYENLIKESMAHPEKDFFFIVPEQYTLQTQKSVVEKHPNHGTMNIDIVSFPRLAYRIFEELSYFPKQILEDMGKRMILRKIMEEQKDHLQVFGNSVKKHGFVEEMKSMISEFYQYQVPMDQLKALDTKDQNRLGLKLHDLVLIREEFQKYLEKDVIVAEQLLEVLAVKAAYSDKLKDSVIYIDGFTGFTPIQNQLLGVLLKTAEKIIVTITADPGVEKVKYMNPHALFALSNRMAASLKHLCEEEGIVMDPPIYFGEMGKPPIRLEEKSDLAALEAGLFRIKNRIIYEETPKHITLFSGRDLHEEVRNITKQIARLVREEGIRYRDIAVIAGDMNAYAPHFEQCLKELNIPYFIDHKKSILNNPCIETIRGLYQLCEENFSYNSVFRYLKAGMTSLGTQEIDELENYALARGVNSKKRWMAPFDRALYGQTEAQLGQLNNLREQFLDEVLAFYEKSKQKDQTVRAHMTALYEFLVCVNAEEDMGLMADAFKKEGDYVMEKTYRQIYPYLLGMMDKMVEILGEEIMDVKEIRGIVETGLEELKIGVIPPGIDQVVVGDLIRTRLKDIKVLFIAGMNEGNIPKASAAGCILNDFEREFLQDAGVSLSETAIQAAYTEQFYLYLAVSKPTDHLYLSYATVSDDGTSIRPSYFLGRISAILPKLTETVMDQEGYFSPEYSMHTFVEGLREYGKEDVPGWKEIGSLVLGPEFLEWYLDACCYENKEAKLSSEAVRLVYGEVLRNSVSRLEQFGACAYSHFLRYGLGLRQREEYKLMLNDLGSIFHRSLEQISKNIQMHYDSWKGIGTEEQEALTAQAVSWAVKEYNETLFYDTHRNSYTIDIIERMTKRTLWAILKQLETSDFKPYNFEVEFKSYKDLDAAHLKLENGAVMRLDGKVDRIDRFEDDQFVYLKVIDYKSGQKSFDLTEIYHGLQLQLVIYMNAMMEIEGKKIDKSIIPAGLFYYRLRDPMVEREPGKSTEDKILKELRLDGYANSDYDILEHFEKDVMGDFVSIHAGKLKSGGISKRAKVLTTEQFTSMQKFASEKMLEAGNQIMDGEIDIRPYRKDRKDSETPCVYCEYRTVCHFDPRYDSYRELEKLKPEDVLERWRGADDDGMDR